MRRFSLLIAILLVIGLTAWLLLFWEPTGLGVPTTVEKPVPPPALAARPTGGDFTLESASGPVRLADLRGRVVLLYFGYTACPDICPTNLVFIGNALRGLRPEELERTRVLFVSVDPERDDVQRLADYSAYFHPNILGVTGTPARIAEVAGLYGAAYRRVDGSGSAMGYLVDHSAYSYLIDSAGRLRRTLDHATPPDEILAAIRELLADERP